MNKKIILDITLGPEMHHILGRIEDSVMGKLTAIGYDVEIRTFPNKESILESEAPVFLGGKSVVMAYEDKNHDNFETWLRKFQQKLGTMTILSDTELFHPRRIGILKKIDEIGTPCRILSPWSFNRFRNIKEYHHDLNASFIDLNYLIADPDNEIKGHLAFCNTTVKDSRQERFRFIDKLKKIPDVMINLDGPTHQKQPYEFVDGKVSRITNYSDKTTHQKSADIDRHPTMVHLKNCNNSQLEIVCETDSQSDEVFYPTEKIYKPISAGHPFIVLAPRHFLRSLRAKGFKTFNKVFDESYDELADTNERMDKICEIVAQMKNKDIKRSCRAITRHNRRRFFEIVVSADLIFAKKLKKIVDLAIKEHKKF